MQYAKLKVIIVLCCMTWSSGCASTPSMQKNAPAIPADLPGMGSHSGNALSDYEQNISTASPAVNIKEAIESPGKDEIPEMPVQAQSASANSGDEPGLKGFRIISPDIKHDAGGTGTAAEPSPQAEEMSRPEAAAAAFRDIVPEQQGPAEDQKGGPVNTKPTPEQPKEKAGIPAAEWLPLSPGTKGTDATLEIFTEKDHPDYGVQPAAAEGAREMSAETKAAPAETKKASLGESAKTTWKATKKPIEALRKNRPGTHVATSQDNLQSLAVKYYSDEKMWTKIYEANKDKIEKGSLEPGQTILIP